MANYNSVYTGAQIDAGIAAANTATQPGDLATVATTGDYADLTNKPTLGTAAATDSTDYATAAQGTLADSALQPGDNVSDLTNDAAYVPSNPTGVTGADAITNIMSLTQAEYDLITPNASTFYVIVG